MSERPSSRRNEQHETRLRRLAGEKASLQLVLRLIQRLNPLASLDDLLRDFLGAIVDTIGGTQCHLWYWDAGELHHVDFLGTNQVVTAVEDSLAREVLERRAFVERTVDLGANLMVDTALSDACSWGFPLLAGSDLIGILTLENLHLRSRALGKYLPAFIDHAAVLLCNELRRLASARAEQALRKKSEELDAYFNQSLDLFAIADTDGTFRKVNPAWQRVLGYSTAELDGVRFLDLVHPDDVPATLAAIARLREQQPVLGFVNRYRHRDGSWRWIEWRSQARGTIIYAAAQDITESRRIREKLLESEALFSQLMAYSPIYIYVKEMTPDGSRLLQASENIVDLVGIPGHEAIGRSTAELFPRDFATKIIADDRAVVSGGQVIKLDEEYGGRSYTTIKFPIRQRDRILLAGFTIDITDRKRDEEERARLQGRMQQAQKMESLGSLAGGIAHDINNVLGAILALASACVEAPCDENGYQRALGTITKAALRGRKTVDALLRFARQDPVEEREMDVNVLVRDEVALLERTTLARVRLDVDLAMDLAPVQGEAAALTNVLMNLCVNAVEAMPHGGSLRLATRNLGQDRVEILVEDTGCGMTREVLERAFDPFFTTKSQEKGTGLGLSMVYSTVRAHHGEIEIQSRPGEGTRVRVRLPACSRPSSFRPASAEGSPAVTRSLRVLLVDDDPLILESTPELLRMLGHSVTTASCGEDALAALEKGLRVDLVILDLNMPGWGGAGTLPRLRALAPELPVLLCTGRADQCALALLGSHPRVTLLTKPFTHDELRMHLASVCGG